MVHRAQGVYRGYVPSEGDAVQREPASISTERMWQDYIHPRRPCILNGLLDDAEWKGSRWTDLAYLRKKAGAAVVRVEPVHPEEDCFGTSTPRTTMSFGEYLDMIQDADAAGKYYLTTQYELDAEEEDEDEDDLDDGPPLDTLLPSPTNKLASDFPRNPRVLGNLVLQQCNLWLGNGKQHKSSGLHHDFHDNLYLLLSGRKRFVLFPPSANEHLHLRGNVQKVHANGLLVYEDPGRIRADGLDALDAAHWRVAACARRLHEAPAPKKSKKTKASGPQRKYDDAKEAYLALRESYAMGDDDVDWDNADAADWDDEGDVDGLALDGEEDDEDYDVEGGDDGEEVEDDKEDDKEAAVNTEEANDDANEPPSFSLIRPHILHKHFGVEPPIPPPSEVEHSALVPGAACPKPLVVDLRPGEMLYLPASWFHEVTSAATDDGPHMALNYWMHPPDGDAVDSPYADKGTWDEIRRRVAEHD